MFSLVLPVVVIISVSFVKRMRSDALQAFLACSLGCILNALLTNIIKVVVGTYFNKFIMEFNFQSLLVNFFQYAF